MIRLLTFTNLYPSQVAPRHGIFVEQRLRRLVATGRVQACVVVPVPHSQWKHKDRSAYAERHGIPVRYCPYPVVRGLTTLFHPRLMARCARRAAETFRAERGPFDVIDAHFLYPDGVGAVHLSKWLRRPVVLSARGSDVNVGLRERVAGHSIRWAARRAAAIIAVSSALRDVMIELGVPKDRITVVRNGVDRELFKPGDRARLRAEFGFTGQTLLSVGNLVPEKGHDLTLAALALLPNVRLVVLGSGRLEASLREQARHLGVDTRVTWLPPVPQADLARYYAAADLSVLASVSEGMPNVVLESLACGTPVVATAVGGSAEVITAPIAGRLIRERSPEILANACREMLEAGHDTDAVRAFSEQFGWDQPITQQLALLERVVQNA
jgi:glycosyltransferase involved in cell wall biosynthesis